MDATGSYRDLRAWQRATELAPRVYALAGSLPKHETYALGDQIRRAVISIAANLAEGRARQHTTEFLQFACVARGSLAEFGYIASGRRKNRVSEQRSTARGTE